MYVHAQHVMFLKKKSGSVGSEFHLGNPPLHAKALKL